MVVSDRIGLDTRGNGQVLDITEEVRRKVRSSGVKQGIVTLFTPSSTSALTTIEYESGAVHDLQTLFDRIAPPGAEYRHNLRWGDGNGHSHVRHALLGPSLTIPIVDGRLTLGTWQQIVFADFDVLGNVLVESGLPARYLKFIVNFPEILQGLPRIFELQRKPFPVSSPLEAEKTVVVAERVYRDLVTGRRFEFLLFSGFIPIAQAYPARVSPVAIFFLFFAGIQKVITNLKF